MRLGVAVSRCVSQLIWLKQGVCQTATANRSVSCGLNGTQSTVYLPISCHKVPDIAKIKSKPPAFLFRLNTPVLLMNLRASLCRMVDAARSRDFPGGRKTWRCCVPPPCYPTCIYIKALLEHLNSTSRPSFSPAGFHDEISE